MTTGERTTGWTHVPSVPDAHADFFGRVVDARPVQVGQHRWSIRSSNGACRSRFGDQGTRFQTSECEPQARQDRAWRTAAKTEDPGSGPGALALRYPAAGTRHLPPGSPNGCYTPRKSTVVTWSRVIRMKSHMIMATSSGRVSGPKISRRRPQSNQRGSNSHSALGKRLSISSTNASRTGARKRSPCSRCVAQRTASS